MKAMIKMAVFAIAFMASGLGFAGDAQLETLANRVDQQHAYIAAALGERASGEEMKKIKQAVDDHVDMLARTEADGADGHVDVFAPATTEDAVYRNIRKLTFLKTFLKRYFSASEVQTILINSNLIATFGKDKLGK